VADGGEGFGCKIDAAGRPQTITARARGQFREGDGAECPAVIPGRAKREPGIHRATASVDEWIPGSTLRVAPE